MGGYICGVIVLVYCAGYKLKNAAVVLLNTDVMTCFSCRLVEKLARTLEKRKLKQFLGLQGLVFRYNSADFVS